MSLKNIRTKIIKRLKYGYIQHDTSRSGDINIKNLLLTGEISVDEIIELINKTKGGQYASSPHHHEKGIDVHIFKPNNWYIKCYLIDPDVVFISVHK